MWTRINLKTDKYSSVQIYPDTCGRGLKLQFCARSIFRMAHNFVLYFKQENMLFSWAYHAYACSLLMRWSSHQYWSRYWVDHRSNPGTSRYWIRTCKKRQTQIQQEITIYNYIARSSNMRPTDPLCDSACSFISVLVSSNIKPNHNPDAVASWLTFENATNRNMRTIKYR